MREVKPLHGHHFKPGLMSGPRRVEEGSRQSVARVVDEDIHFERALFGEGENAGGSVSEREIGLADMTGHRSLTRQAVGEEAESITSASHKDEIVAMLGQELCEGEADPRTRAGDERERSSRLRGR